MSITIFDAQGNAIGKATALAPEQASLRFTDWLSFKRHAEAKVPGIYRRVSAAALQSAELFDWFTTASGQGEVFMDHPETIAGFDALVAAGVITQDERDALFTP